MNNRFKFRTWYEEEGIMDYNITWPFIERVGLNEGLEDITTNKFLNLKLMQSTGLLDKNGKEIFEGDIIIDAGWNIKQYTVKYEVDDAGFYPFSRPSFGGYEWENVDYKTSEIIGNIYEHPNLLKKD